MTDNQKYLNERMIYDKFVHEIFEKFFNCKLYVKKYIDNDIQIIIFDNGYGYYISEKDLHIIDRHIIKINPKVSFTLLYFYIETKLLDIPINLCTECGCDIGDRNPRQLCNKGFCSNI